MKAPQFCLESVEHLGMMVLPGRSRAEIGTIDVHQEIGRQVTCESLHVLGCMPTLPTTTVVPVCYLRLLTLRLPRSQQKLNDRNCLITAPLYSSMSSN